MPANTTPMTHLSPTMQGPSSVLWASGRERYNTLFNSEACIHQDIAKQVLLHPTL
ncbi:hypothetical protein ACLOJK_015446 [Asimina triloba]